MASAFLSRSSSGPDYRAGSSRWSFVSQLLGLLGIYFRFLGTMSIFSVVHHLEPVQ